MYLYKVISYAIYYVSKQKLNRKRTGDKQMKMRWVTSVIDTGKVVSDVVVEYSRSELLEVFDAEQRKFIKNGGTIQWTCAGANHDQWSAVGYKV